MPGQGCEVRLRDFMGCEITDRPKRSNSRGVMAIDPQCKRPAIAEGRRRPVLQGPLRGSWARDSVDTTTCVKSHRGHPDGLGWFLRVEDTNLREMGLARGPQVCEGGTPGEPRRVHEASRASMLNGGVGAGCGAQGT